MIGCKNHGWVLTDEKVVDIGFEFESERAWADFLELDGEFLLPDWLRTSHDLKLLLGKSLLGMKITFLKLLKSPSRQELKLSSSTM